MMTPEERHKALQQAIPAFVDKTGRVVLHMVLAGAYGYLDYPTPIASWPEDRKQALLDELETWL